MLCLPPTSLKPRSSNDLLSHRSRSPSRAAGSFFGQSAPQQTSHCDLVACTTRRRVVLASVDGSAKMVQRAGWHRGRDRAALDVEAITPQASILHEEAARDPCHDLIRQGPSCLRKSQKGRAGGLGVRPEAKRTPRPSLVRGCEVEDVERRVRPVADRRRPQTLCDTLCRSAAERLVLPQQPRPFEMVARLEGSVHTAVRAPFRVEILDQDVA